MRAAYPSSKTRVNITSTTNTTAPTSAKQSIIEAKSQDAQTEIPIEQCLRILKTVLGPSTSITAPKVSNTRPASKRPTRTATIVNPTKVRTVQRKAKSAETTSQRPYAGSDSPQLPRSEEDVSRLATTSFNKSLKALSLAVKSNQKATIDATEKCTTPSETDGKPCGTISDYARRHGPHKSTRETTGNEELNLHAQCAVTALEILVLARNTTIRESDLESKLQQGALLLLDKLVSLKFTDLAMAVLRRIDDQYWKKRKSPLQCSCEKDLAELLIYESEISTQEDFDFVCSLQSQALRLALCSGTNVVCEQLSDATSLRRTGSPARVLTTGYERGMISQNKLAAQLRTVSQALLKLGAKSASVGGAGIRERTFDLQVEALLIKIKVWAYSGPSTKHQEELWLQFDSAIRKFWGKDIVKQEEKYKHITGAVRNVEQALREVDVGTTPSPALTDYLMLLAETHDHIDQVLELLEASRSQLDTQKALLHLFKLVALRIEHTEDLTKLLACLEDVMTHPVGLILENTDELLILVRLRKACYNFLLNRKDTDESVATRCKQCCIRIIGKTLSILWTQTRTTESSHVKVREGINTAIARTIDTIVCIEQVITDNTLLEDYIVVVNQCSEPLRKDILSENTSTKHGLLVRISNVYWRLHLRSDLPSGQLCHSLVLAERSIAVLEDVPVDMLSKAAKGLKLEHISVIYQGNDDHEKGKSYLLQSIKYYVTAGALADAVEASLSTNSGTVWSDPSSSAMQLARVLDNFARTCQQVEESQSTTSYDDEQLPDIYRAVLLEYQLGRHTRRSRYKGISQPCLTMITCILDLAKTDEYAVWRMRFLSKLLCELMKGNDRCLTEVSDLIASQELRCSKVLMGTTALSRYHRSVHAILQLQLSLLRKWHLDDEVHSHIQTLHDLVLACTTVSELEGVVDDLDMCLGVLKEHADRAEAVGNAKLRLDCSAVRVHILSLLSQDNHNLLSGLVEMLESCNELDKADTASQLTDRIENIAARESPPDTLHMSCFLAVGNHYLNTFQQSNCLTALAKAGDIYHRALPQGVTTSDSQRIRYSIMARGSLLASRLAFLSRDLGLAVSFARQAAKITTSLFAALEKTFCASLERSTEDLSTLVEATACLTISTRKVETRKMVGSEWIYVADHLRSLANIAEVLAHQGLYTDSLHCLQQAEKIVSQGLWQNDFHFKPKLALMHARAGKSLQARDILKTLEQGKRDDLTYRLSLCETYMELGDASRAKDLLRKLALKSDLDDASIMLEVQPGRLRRSNAETRTRRKDCKATDIVGQTKKQRVSKNNAADPFNASDTAKTILARTQDLGAGRESRSTIRQRELKDRWAALQNSLELEICVTASLETNCAQTALLAQATSLVNKASKQLSEDGMTAVLAESAAAVPAQEMLARRRSRVSMITTTQPGHDRSTALAAARNFVLAAKEKLGAVQSLDKAQYPSTAIHEMQKLNAKISFLLSTMDVPLELSPLELVLSSHEAKDIALDREMMVVASETTTQDRLSLTTWPSLVTSSKTDVMSKTTQARIDTLPASWSVISIGLSCDQRELLVSRITSRETPFTLRIPLTRSNESDQEHDFAFATANSELIEIVEQANETAHATHDTSDKVAWKAWHADREALDNRLKLWLSNIESLWFGGFQGVFMPYQLDSKLVTQFGTVVEQALNRHLPSRRKTCTVTSSIHPHVLSLFLGLGSPNDVELDDALLDLLYFTVDLLHFSGEINAYDEIDFDSLLASVLDAISAFHSQADLSSQTPKHTILILDKELEHFPFESMPCLRHYPVSRMRTLGSVFRAVDKISSQSAHSQEPAANTYILSKSTCQGACFLNPSLDLCHTQSTLGPILERHTPAHWTRMVAHTPTEIEFKEVLASKDLFLYFGHGSGAQYIRGRIIRSLPKAPVTLLMGCSSSKMTQYGKYESVGMPNYYQLAGSMAVVGTLWDVTDRDIDRFAVKTLAEWGLFDAQDEDVIEVLKLKGRRGRKQREEAEDSAREAKEQQKNARTLVEAVRKGRDACLLRYLCGAAVVVYGVPVTLE